MTPTPDRWSDLEALAEKATPGPWTRDYGGQNWWIASCGIGEGDMTVWSPNSPTPDHGGEREDDGGEADRTNAAYIVALVNAAPDLLAVVRAAQGVSQFLPGAVPGAMPRGPFLDAADALRTALSQGATDE